MFNAIIIHYHTLYKVVITGPSLVEVEQIKHNRKALYFCNFAINYEKLIIKDLRIIMYPYDSVRRDSPTFMIAMRMKA